MAALLVDLDHTVSPTHLINVIWDEEPPSTASAQVQNCLSDLRRRLVAAGLEPDALTRGPGGYRLIVGPDRVDAARFEARLASARRRAAAGDIAGAVDEIVTGLTFWRGPALAGVHSTALQSQARRLEQMRFAGREELARLRVSAGEHQLAAAELSLLTAEQPLHEPLYALWMRALHAAGRRAEALAVFRRARSTFRSELGLDPSDELRELERLVLSQPAATPTAAQPPVDPPAPEPVPGTAAPDASQQVPAQPTPRLLPPDIADFTAREAEVEQVRLGLAGAADPASTALTVVAIAGMGGVGKTALAVHVAHRVADAFPDGHLFMNLRGAEPTPVDPAEALGRFLRTLGIDSRAVPADVTERSDLYRSRLAGRRMLVVLDNAGSERQVRPLLPGTAGCAVIVTSRQHLTGIESARPVDLDGFAPGQAIELLARMVGEQRVGGEQRAAARIVTLCAGLPLAIRVAGARLLNRPRWRLDQLASQLDDERWRLDQLAVGDLAVRASLALSYDGLPEPTRRLFRLLGHFDTADFPAWLAAVGMECTLDEGTRRLEALVDAQLLVDAGLDAAGQVRYRFHDLVRLFARERAAAEDSGEEVAEVLTRGLGAWLAVAERMAERVPGPCYAAMHGSAVRPSIGWADKLASLDALVWFDAERTSLVAVIWQACALGLDELAFDLAGCLEKYLDLRGMYADWRRVNEHVLRACEQAGNLRGQATMLRGLAEVTTWSGPGEGVAMVRFHEQADALLRMFTELGDQRGMADAAVMCAWGLVALGEHRRAGEIAAESLRLAEASGHLGGQARAHIALAIARYEGGAVDAQTLAHVTQSLAAARMLGNPRYESTALQFLAIANLEQGELDACARALDQSMAISHLYGDNYTLTLTMLVLARLQLAQADPRATMTAEASLALGREYSMSHHVATALGLLGEIDLSAGRREQARARLEEAVRLWRTRGWLSFLAKALEGLGTAYADVDWDAAHAAWTEAHDLFHAIGNEAGQQRLARLLAGV